MNFTPHDIRAAAAAIANSRAGRRGVPPISNVLDILPPKLLSEVMADAQAALEAVAIRASRSGVDPKIAARLTYREKQIVELLYLGMLTDDIAERLQISGATVKNHIKGLFDKFHVHSRRELLAELEARQ